MNSSTQNPQSRSGMLGALAYTVLTAVLSATIVLVPTTRAWAQGAQYYPAPTTQPPPPPSTLPPPPNYQAQIYRPDDTGTALADATRDASADTSGILWFGAGCVLGVIGVLLSYVIEPSVPTSRLIGKSPNYVAAYSDAYRSAGRSSQGKTAIIGCLVGYGAAAVIYLVAFSSVLAARTTY